MIGKVISYKPCNLEGCSGTMLLVEWPIKRKGMKSNRTWPCTKGLTVVDETTWEIM